MAQCVLPVNMFNEKYNHRRLSKEQYLANVNGDCSPSLRCHLVSDNVPQIPNGYVASSRPSAPHKIDPLPNKDSFVV